MPVSYKPLSELRFDDLFDGGLAKLGIYERVTSKATATHRSLTDGTNSVWVDADNTGSVARLTVWGTNNPHPILDAVTSTLSVEIVSEFEPKYWGYQSKEEWELARSAEVISSQYSMLVSHSSAQIHAMETELPALDAWDRYAAVLDILRCRIAARLVDADPSLREVENKFKLLKAVAAEYRSIEEAIAWESYIDDHMKHDSRSQLSQEDSEEGPLSCFRYELNETGQIVAVEQQELRARRRALHDDGIPF